MRMVLIANRFPKNACLDALGPLGDSFYRPAPDVRADPIQGFRIGSSVTHLLFECIAVQFEVVEKIAIETDSQIDIVLNLAGMTERNLVDDLPKMSDTSHLDFQTPRIVCADGAVPRIALALRPGKTVS